jgi:hypothetical protein
MKTVVKFSIALLALFVPALHSAADTKQLACRGETYVVASGEKQAIKRFSRRNLTLTSDEDRTAITYGDGGPMEADITEFLNSPACRTTNTGRCVSKGNASLRNRLRRYF